MKPILADTTLNSGKTTVSTGTSFGTNLYVASTGTATLEVIAGGYATNTIGYLGFNAGSAGTATVSSGTWANSGNLTVGRSGTGTLTMTGGLVSVSGTLSQGTHGTINLSSGGTLQIGTGGAGGVLGVSTLTNNGTLIFNLCDASTYSGIISGTGAVTKQGGGTLTLSGNNSYTGGTTISVGAVALSGTGSIGTGGLNLGTNARPGVFAIAGLTAGTYSLPSSGSLPAWARSRAAASRSPCLGRSRRGTASARSPLVLASRSTSQTPAAACSRLRAQPSPRAPLTS